MPRYFDSLNMWVLLISSARHGMRFSRSISIPKYVITSCRGGSNDHHRQTKFMLKLSKLYSNAIPNDSTAYPAPLASWDAFKRDDYLLTVKGAPDVLLSRCDSVVNPTGGNPLALTWALRERIVAVQEEWAAKGRRVLLLTRKVIPYDEIPPKLDRNSEEFADVVNDLNSDLMIVGLVGLIDPLKPDIIETVRKCRGAGIRFFVVTGVSKHIEEERQKSLCNRGSSDYLCRDRM